MTTHQRTLFIYFHEFFGKLFLFAVATVLQLTSLQAIGAKPRVAIIGGGGSGLTTAWLLDHECDVTLYEAADRLGGHANTIAVDVKGTQVPIEAGFEFISENQFPYFCHFLQNILQIPLHKYTLTTNFYETDGSRTFVLPPYHEGIIEWKSLSPRGLFTMLQLKIVIDKAHQLIETAQTSISLEEFVEPLFLTHCFKEQFLYPFLAANFGVKVEDIKLFSAYNALKYLVLGGAAHDYRWIEIVGGSQKYIQAVAAQLERSMVHLATPVREIQFHEGLFKVITSEGDESVYDHVVIATNAIQAAKLLNAIEFATPIQAILKNIEYFKTRIALHGDTRFMPQKRADWRVVNIRYNGNESAITVFKEWLSPQNPIFKSWLTYDVRADNDGGAPLPSPLYALVEYDHPKVDLKYFETQRALQMMQGVNNLWIAGNYTFDNDSHESAIRSALFIASKIAPSGERVMMLNNPAPISDL